MFGFVFVFSISSIGVVLRQEDDKKDEEENDDAKYFDHQPTIGSYAPEENQDKGLLRNDVTERGRKNKDLVLLCWEIRLTFTDNKESNTPFHFKLKSQFGHLNY